MKLAITGEAARKAICRHVLAAPESYIVEIKPATRSLEQNAALWAALSDIANQAEWHGIKLSAEEWKDLLSAGLVKSKVVPNITGDGFVILGQRTSKMTKRQMGDLLDLVYAFGTEHGVKFSEPDRWAA